MYSCALPYIFIYMYLLTRIQSKNKQAFNENFSRYRYVAKLLIANIYEKYQFV